jgi:hypothetical protein
MEDNGRTSREPDDEPETTLSSGDMDSVKSLRLTLAAAADRGFEVEIESSRGRLGVGQIQPSGDPLLPWRTSSGQMEPSLEVAALRLAAGWLEDEQMDLRSRLS